MGLDKASKKALLDKMRRNQKKSSGNRDPREWRPKFVKDKTLKFRVYILPPLMEGDTCLGKTGEETTCENEWDLWYYQNGHHYVNKKRYQCPRIHGTGDCPMCDTGFDLMRDVDEKDTRRAIAREWLSQESRSVNLYFADHKDNPEDLRGQVKWWNLPNRIFEQCVACIDREDEGDEDDPKPFGLFFDPEDAFAIIIELKEKSEYNNYDDSRMLAKSGPIADSEGAIEAILNQRSDIPLKFDAPNPEALAQLVDEKLAQSTEGEDGGFDDDGESKKKASEKKASEKKAEAKKESTKTEAKQEKKKPAETVAEEKAEEPAAEEPAEEKEDSTDAEVDPEMAALLKQLE